MMAAEMGTSRPVSPGGQLVGRQREREILNRLLDAGRGGVLVVHGEAGVGKTALLEYAVETGRGYQVARTSGVEAEAELPFAALQQLCSPFLDLLDHLPQPQQRGARGSVRTQWWDGAESVLGRIGSPRPLV